MRRRWRPLLAVALLAALVGCSDAGGPDDTSAGGGTTTTVASDAGTTATTGADQSRAGGAPGGSPTTAATVASGSPATAPAPSGASLVPGAVGQLAPALLRPGNGNRIVVEVRAQEGAAPSVSTVQHIVRALRDASGKVDTDGVAAVGGGPRAWSASDLASAADASARFPQGGDQVVLRLLFLHGSFGGDESVLGVAVRGDVAAIFSDQVDTAAGVLVSPGVVEDAVTMHEVGHLLGLVDLVLRTGRADPDHPGHSTNQDSVMYWAVESDVISQLLDGGIPNELDDHDRSDLARIRAG